MNTQTVNKELTNVAKDAKEVRDNMESTVKNAAEDLVTQGQKTYREASRYVRGMSKNIQGSAEEAVHSMRASVKSRPLLYVVGAISLGALLGALMGRRRTRSV